MEINDALIEGILKIGNHPYRVKCVQPNILHTFKLEKWMVVRTLDALDLLLERMEERE